MKKFSLFFVLAVLFIASCAPLKTTAIILDPQGAKHRVAVSASSCESAKKTAVAILQNTLTEKSDTTLIHTDYEAQSVSVGKGCHCTVKAWYY